MLAESLSVFGFPLLLIVLWCDRYLLWVSTILMSFNERKSSYHGLNTFKNDYPPTNQLTYQVPEMLLHLKHCQVNLTWKSWISWLIKSQNPKVRSIIKHIFVQGVPKKCPLSPSLNFRPSEGCLQEKIDVMCQKNVEYIVILWVYS